MCDDCRCEDNYLKLIACVVEHLRPLNQELWLRSVCGCGNDNARSMAISRCVAAQSGYVLAIWNGTGRGWRLRCGNEGNDAPIDPDDRRFQELTEEMLFQLETLNF